MQLRSITGQGWGLIVYQLIVLLSVPFYFMSYRPSWLLLLCSVALLYMAGIGITAAYHRLYSHQAYKMHWLIEPFFLFMGTIAVQGSAVQWSHDHRLHHRYVDQDKDPYSVKKGFWYAHFLWLLGPQRKIDERLVTDLLANPMVRFQHRFYFPLMIASNALTTILVGLLTGDLIGAVVISLGLRLFLSHHFTWFINSLAHYWGTQSFSKEHSAVDNWVIALLTYGEGYHNYHHTFAYDYRNGTKWYHFDPTKWIVWSLSKIGLTSGLKRVSSYTHKGKMIFANREEMLAKIKAIAYVDRGKIEARIEELHAKLTDSIQSINLLYVEYRKQRKAKNAAMVAKAKMQLKEKKKAFKLQLRTWKRVNKGVMRLRPFPI